MIFRLTFFSRYSDLLDCRSDSIRRLRSSDRNERVRLPAPAPLPASPQTRSLTFSTHHSKTPHNSSLIIPTGTSRPTSLILRTNTSGGPLPASYTEEKFDFPIQGPSSLSFNYYFFFYRCTKPPRTGFGLHWEADAVARSIRDGEKENKRMPWKESLLTMKVSRVTH